MCVCVYMYVYIHTHIYIHTHAHTHTHTNTHIQASMVTQMVKNLPAMQETWVRSLNQEDILERGMATHSSILAGKIPYTEKPGRLQFRGSQRVKHD